MWDWPAQPPFPNPVSPMRFSLRRRDNTHPDPTLPTYEAQREETRLLTDAHDELCNLSGSKHSDDTCDREDDDGVRTRSFLYLLVMVEMVEAMRHLHEDAMRSFLSVLLMIVLAIFPRRWLFALSIAYPVGKHILYTLPYASNHTTIGLVLKVACLVVLTFDRDSDSRLYRRLVATGSIILGPIYLFAGWHKLNWDFLLNGNGCIPSFLMRLCEKGLCLDPELFSSFLSASAMAALRSSFHCIIAVCIIMLEISIGLLLLSPGTLRSGIALALMLQGPLSLIGFENFYGAVLPSFYLLLAANLRTSPLSIPSGLLRRARWQQLAAVLTSANGRLGGLDRRVLVFVAFIAVGLVLVQCVNTLPGKAEKAYEMRRGLVIFGSSLVLLGPAFLRQVPRPTRRPHDYVLLLIVVIYAMSPYLGLRTTGTFSMFSNLQTEGPSSNHVLLSRNQLKVFGFQEDAVLVLEVHGRSRRRKSMPKAGQRIPRIAFDDLLAGQVDHGYSPEFTVFYRNTTIHHWPSTAKPSYPWLFRKLMGFRPWPHSQEPGDGMVCRW